MARRLAMSKEQEIYDTFKRMTPKERNERLQALFASKLSQREEIDNLSVELFKALMKSFDISIKFDESQGHEELFDVSGTDIKAIRNEHNKGLEDISEENRGNDEPLSGEDSTGSTDTSEAGEPDMV